MSLMSSIRRSGALALVAVTLAAGTAEAVDIREVTSPEGQVFWLVEEPSVPVVAVEMGFVGGSRLDPAEKLGLTTFTASLMSEGAGDLDAVAWADRADEISARIDVSSYADRVEVSARFLSETLDESVEFLATTLSQPRFDETAIERVRAQRLSVIASAETDPQEVASDAWWHRAFGDHPYGRTNRGTAETVAALGENDFREAHARMLTRANAYVAIVGDISAERAGEMVDRLLAGLPDGEKIHRDQADDTPPPGVEVVDLAVPQSVVVFGQEGLARDDPDFIPAYVMNYVLGGGGLNSRLTEEVREKRGLAYSVYSYLQVLDEAKLYMGGVQTANERVAESIDVIKAEWARMAREGMTEDELAKAKTYLTGSFPLRFDSNSKIAGFLLFAQLEDLGIDYINKRNDMIEAVTLEDVNRVAAELLKPEALSFVVVGQPDGLTAAE